MDNKLLTIIAKQIKEEASELDLELYEGTYSRLMFIAKIIMEMSKDSTGTDMEEKLC